MEGGSGFPAPIMVDVRRRKLAIITMNVSVLAAALSWLLVLFSVMYSPAAIPWALGVAIVLTVIGAYALYRYYSKYSHMLPKRTRTRTMCSVTTCTRLTCRICTTRSALLTARNSDGA